jgi:HSP20 family protein
MSWSGDPKGRSGGGKKDDLRPRLHLLWAAGRPGADTESYMPPMDIYEIDDHLVIEIDLPGVKKDSINVYMQKNVISVEGVKGETGHGTEKGGKRVSFLQVERKFGIFQRNIELPVDCNVDELKASYKNGILVIDLKKIKKNLDEKVRVPVE